MYMLKEFSNDITPTAVPAASMTPKHDGEVVWGRSRKIKYF